MTDVLSKRPHSAARGDRGGDVGGGHGRPASAGASATKSGSRGLYIDKGDDEVLKRFQEAPRRSSISTLAGKSSGGGSLGYNNAGAAAPENDKPFDKFNANNANIANSAAAAKKSAWNTDELYRVARTQGQASRVTARTNKSATLRSPPRGAAETSHSATYASSHAARGSGQSRFSWDA